MGEQITSKVGGVFLSKSSTTLSFKTYDRSAYQNHTVSNATVNTSYAYIHNFEHQRLSCVVVFDIFNGLPFFVIKNNASGAFTLGNVGNSFLYPTYSSSIYYQDYGNIKPGKDCLLFNYQPKLQVQNKILKPNSNYTQLS